MQRLKGISENSGKILQAKNDFCENKSCLIKTCCTEMCGECRTFIQKKYGYHDADITNIVDKTIDITIVQYSNVFAKEINLNLVVNRVT